MKSDQAKFNCPQHTGITDKIRAALERSTEPLSIHNLVLRTGIEAKKVRKAVGILANRTGGVMSVKRQSGVCYTIFKPKAEAKPDKARPYRIAGRITIPSYRWGGIGTR